MSISEKEKQANRDKILAAAHKCFTEHGFHATGMAELSKACRMSVGNLYHYFPKKAAIIQAIADETRLRILPVLQRLELHEDPVEGIVEFILISVREFCRDSNARLWTEVLAEASRNQSLRELWISCDRELRDLLKRLLRRAVRTGQSPPDLDVEATSLWLTALLDGAIARVSVQPELSLTRTLGTLSASIRRSLCAQPA